MRRQRIHMPNLSYIAAFVIGVILFAATWQELFGSASNTIVLAGTAGVAFAVTAFWIRNETQHRGNKD